MIRHFCLWILVVLIGSNVAAASEEFKCTNKPKNSANKQLLQAVEKRYQQISDLQAEFIQYSYFVGLNQRVTSTGTVFFKKPGMMNWIYLEPDAQSFVSDGETFWFYQPDLNQATIADFKQSFTSDLPVSFLLGIGKLAEKFSLLSSCRAGKRTVLALEPLTPDPNLERFELLVESADRAPVGARVTDIGGNETTIVFPRMKVDVGVSEKQFSFTVPRGVDIIDHRRKKTDES